MKNFSSDLRHAIRLYIATPGASLLCILVLAVAMACFSAFFSLYNALALKAHPGFERSGELVTIGLSDGARFLQLRSEAIHLLRDGMTTLQALEGVRAVSMQAEQGGPVQAEAVTDGFFAGVRPRLLLGRAFDERDHASDAEPVVVLSHRYWREHFDGRADVLGQTLTLNSPGTSESPREHRIIGVMAPELPGVFAPEVAFWMPEEQVPSQGDIFAMMGIAQMRVLGRLAGGASLEAVVAELQARYGEEGDALGVQPGFRLDAVGGVVRDINVQRDAERQVRLFLAGSILLALVAAANVSLFLLARAPGRRRELGIRMAVGAPLKRLARQLVSEAALLVLIAAVLGILLSLWLAVLLREAPFLQGADWRSLTPDALMLALAALFALLLTALVSLAPVAGLRRLTIADSSRAVTARAGLAQRLAGTAQIAIAATLAAGSLAFGWHLVWLIDQRGYDTAHLHLLLAQREMVSAQSQGPADVSANMARVAVDRERWREVIDALPGVEGVAFGSMVPGGQSFSGTAVQRPDGSPDPVFASHVAMDHEYLRSLNMQLVHGRYPEQGDTSAVWVNEALARELWGRVDVVGEALPRLMEQGEFDTVTGVVRNFSFEHPAADRPPTLFRLGGSTGSGDQILIRSRLGSAELRALLQRRIDEGALDFNIGRMDTLDALAGALIAADRARASLTAGSALLVVLMAVFGFHGTQRYLVAAGRREYAVRAALGAGPRRVGRLVLWRGLVLGLPGLLLGALLAFVLVAWLRDDFVAAIVSPGLVAAAVTAGVVILLLAASAGPAHQARRLAPAEQLREE